LKRTDQIPTMIAPGMAVESPHLFGELTTTSEDVCITDRWNTNVLKIAVNSVIHKLSSPEYGTEEKIANTLTVMPKLKYTGGLKKLKLLGPHAVIPAPSRLLPGCLVGRAKATCVGPACISQQMSTR
jgi:hypothetical protein